MAKSWKSLFIKDEEEMEVEAPSTEKEDKRNERPSFSASSSSQAPSFNRAKLENPATPDPLLKEILDVYEKGIQNINMPGYDFFEFYSAISSVGTANEQVFRMAFQMAQTMDQTITVQKLTSDAEFYISKIKEVHQQYATQGRRKLEELSAKTSANKEQLTAEVKKMTAEVNRLKEQLQSLERKIGESNKKLQMVEQIYKPEQEAVQQKLVANDQAVEISISKLTSVKEGISKYLTT